jgi:hypothetical protein
VLIGPAVASAQEEQDEEPHSKIVGLCGGYAIRCFHYTTRRHSSGWRPKVVS